jgi:hypothetical protein
MDMDHALLVLESSSIQPLSGPWPNGPKSTKTGVGVKKGLVSGNFLLYRSTYCPDFSCSFPPPLKEPVKCSSSIPPSVLVGRDRHLCETARRGTIRQHCRLLFKSMFIERRGWGCGARELDPSSAPRWLIIPESSIIHISNGLSIILARICQMFQKHPIIV